MFFYNKYTNFSIFCCDQLKNFAISSQLSEEFCDFVPRLIDEFHDFFLATDWRISRYFQATYWQILRFFLWHIDEFRRDFPQPINNFFPNQLMIFAIFSNICRFFLFVTLPFSPLNKSKDWTITFLNWITVAFVQLKGSLFFRFLAVQNTFWN